MRERMCVHDRKYVCTYMFMYVNLDSRLCVRNGKAYMMQELRVHMKGEERVHDGRHVSVCARNGRQEEEE